MVVIDEAHNLMEAINTIHSVVVSGSLLSCSRSQLVQYLSRYSSRLLPSSLAFVSSLISLIDRLLLLLLSPSLSSLNPSSFSNPPSDSTSSSSKPTESPSTSNSSTSTESSESSSSSSESSSTFSSFSTREKEERKEEELVTVTELLFGIGLPDLNPLVLHQWCRQSEISKKVFILSFFSSS